MPSGRLRALRAQRPRFERVAPRDNLERNRLLREIRDSLGCRDD
jgi:hypothetical protein